MNKNIICLKHVFEITQRDQEIEQTLFSAFQEGVHECLRSLDNSPEQYWFYGLHTLKGLAYNMGATALGDLCSHLETLENLSLSDKREKIEEVKKLYNLSEEAIQKELNA